MITFLRILIWFMLKCRIYYTWSSFYQATFERYSKKVKLPEYDSIEELENVLGRMKWVKDGIWELGDAIGSPQATYFKYYHNSKQAKDCDEFAIFAASRLRNMKDRCKLSKDVRAIGMLSVPWHGPKGIGGHNVCVFSYVTNEVEKWAYLGNWYQGKARYGFASLNEVAIEVLGGNTSLGWAFVNEKLELLKYRWNV